MKKRMKWNARRRWMQSRFIPTDRRMRENSCFAIARGVSWFCESIRARAACGLSKWPPNESRAHNGVFVDRSDVRRADSWREFGWAGAWDQHCVGFWKRGGSAEPGGVAGGGAD